MPYELVNAENERYRLPASIAPEQRHIGGEPTVRLVRAYGSNVIHRLDDGHRLPQVLKLTGLLFSDHSDPLFTQKLGQLRRAVKEAVCLVHVSTGGVDIERLELLGALPITTSPAGVDSSLRTVTIALLPAERGWTSA